MVQNYEHIEGNMNTDLHPEYKPDQQLYYLQKIKSLFSSTPNVDSGVDSEHVVDSGHVVRKYGHVKVYSLNETLNTLEYMCYEKFRLQLKLSLKLGKFQLKFSFLNSEETSDPVEITRLVQLLADDLCRRNRHVSMRPTNNYKGWVGLAGWLK